MSTISRFHQNMKTNQHENMMGVRVRVCGVKNEITWEGRFHAGSPGSGLLKRSTEPSLLSPSPDFHFLERNLTKIDWFPLFWLQVLNQETVILMTSTIASFTACYPTPLSYCSLLLSFLKLLFIYWLLYSLSPIHHRTRIGIAGPVFYPSVCLILQTSLLESNLLLFLGECVVTFGTLSTSLEWYQPWSYWPFFPS